MWKSVGIVLDSTGKPRFDDINNVSEEVRAALRPEHIAKLTPEERRALRLEKETN